MAVTAALTTSKCFSGYAARSIDSSTRAKENDGSGSPMAAELPRTKMRQVPGAFFAGSRKGSGRRTRAGEKNGAVHQRLSRQMAVPSAAVARRAKCGE